jgi:hypothetical protein
VRECSDGLGFALETCQRLGIVRELGGEHFDRYCAAEPGVAGAVDLAHAAFAELGGDLVGAEPRADQGAR